MVAWWWNVDEQAGPAAGEQVRVGRVAHEHSAVGAPAGRYGLGDAAALTYQSVNQSINQSSS